MENNNMLVSNDAQVVKNDNPSWAFNVHLKDVGLEEKPFAYNGKNLSAVFALQRTQAEIFFQGEDGYLHYYYEQNGRWKHEGEVFKIAGKVTGEISAVYALQRSHAEVFFKGEDGYLHYYYVENGRWKHDGEAFKAAGKVTGDISAVYAFQRSHAEVFFKGEDGYLHYYYVENGRWKHDREAFKAAGKVAGEISAVYAQQRSYVEVFFKGEDGYLHYYFVENKDWKHDGEAFKAAGKVAGEISAVYAQQRSHAEVFFKGEDGYLHYYYVENKDWKHDGEAFKAAGKITGDISVVYAVQRSHAEVFFKGENGYLHYYYMENKDWKHDGEAFKAAGKVTGDISGVYALQRNHAEVFFNGEDGKIQYYFCDVNTKDWRQALYPAQEDIDKALEESKRVFDIIRDLGGKFVRTDFSWNLLEPSEGYYRNSFLEFCRKYVELAKEKDIQVICVLYQTPVWAKVIAQANPDIFYLKYKAYCKKIASEMKGKVYYYQLWNEPNNLLSFLFDEKDKFSFNLDFIKMFNTAETGLDEAGYPYIVMLNFLLNFVTELMEFIGPEWDRIINQILNPLLVAFKTCKDLVGLLSKDISDILNNGIELLRNLKEKFSLFFSWKTAIQYFIDQNQHVNPNTNIKIYGIDHYPGTWSSKQSTDWSPLKDTAEMLEKHKLKLAIIETGFATWFGNSEGEVDCKKIAANLCDDISQLFIYILRGIEYGILEAIRAIISTVIPISFDELKKIIDSSIIRDEDIKLLFRGCLYDQILNMLESIPLKDHTFKDQVEWIRKSIPALYLSPFYSSLEFINWYELKDNGTGFLTPHNYFRFFEIAEDNFGILLEDGTHKAAYDVLKTHIQSAL